MLAILTILLCLFSVTFHELGHAWAMRAVGVPIRTISLLGFPAFKLPYFSWQYQPKWQESPISIQIHTLLLGAYVEPDAEGMKALSVRDSAFVSGAGPFASFVYGIVMLSAAMISVAPSGAWIFISATLIVLALMYALRRFICQYVVLVLGIAMLVLLLVFGFSHPQEMAVSMGGPVKITQQFHAEYTTAVVNKHEMFIAFFLPGFLSIALGLTNALPIIPLDGGHIAEAYLSKVNKRAGEIFSKAGFVLFLILMVASIGGDINVVVDWFFGLFR